MKLLDMTLSGPAENLALDEALLDQAEGSALPDETLRLWEPSQPMVVVGRSSRVEVEVHIEQCQRLGVPILRRSSGGAAIVTGPGCLMYSLVLSYCQRPELRAIAEAHRYVLQTLIDSLAGLVADVSYCGCSDLARGDRKFSGNSLRCKRTHLLYHGTLLYDFPLEMVGDCLATPPRQPDYRKERDHLQFLENLPVTAADLRRAIITGFGADEALQDWPRQRTEQLVKEKYSRDAWNRRL